MRRFALLASLSLVACGSAPPRPESNPSEEERSASTADTAATVGAADELTAAQIRAVVTRERPGIQRCYEQAAVAVGRAPGIRLDVDATIGPAGRPTRVHARGPALGTLRECVEQAMRAWTFPARPGTTRTSIPYVFLGRD